MIKMRLAALTLAGASSLILASSAAGRDWVLISSSGVAPERTLRLVDASSIIRSDPDAVKLDMALLDEQGTPAPQAILKFEVNCAERTGRITHAQLREEDGTPIAEIADEYGDTLEDSYRGGLILDIACNDHWSESSIYFGQTSLSAIFPFLDEVDEFISKK